MTHTLIPASWATPLLLGLVLLALGCDVGLLPFRLPQNARQVPSSIVARSDGSGALQFGFEMGTGLRTFMPTHLPYVLVSLILLAAPWWSAPFAGFCFGAGRAIMVLSAVRRGNAADWDRDFAARKKAILTGCWFSMVCALAVIVISVT
ncbi:hypothetical protein GCM10009850_026310 [Nonomuraea monospora]|uniref:MAPEG family protein n=1 Tax=Nonomuraea monospora TaxID=568818 RepID=A0ABN3CCQ3_9ACTN